MEKVYADTVIITPTSRTVSILAIILPLLFLNTSVALKKTPDPITIPATIQIAVGKPNFLFNLLFIG
jgi:hypothetical protein